MLEDSLYAYIWRTTRPGQIRIIVLTLVISPLTMLPLELQRRIVTDAISARSIRLIAVLGGTYLAILLIQGGLKYLLNVQRGIVLEDVTRDLRHRIIRWEHHASAPGPSEAPPDAGTRVSMLAAESEDVGGFASESISVPLMQIGTIVWVVGYLMWLKPAIAVLALLIYAPQVILVPLVQRKINRMIRMKTARIRKLGTDAAELFVLTGDQRGRRQWHAGLLVENVYRIRILIYENKYFLTFLGNFLDALGPLVVLVLGGILVIRGQATAATLVVFISGFQKISDPWDVLVNFFRTVSNARVSYALVADVLNDTGHAPLDAARHHRRQHLLSERLHRILEHHDEALMRDTG